MPQIYSQITKLAHRLFSPEEAEQFVAALHRQKEYQPALIWLGEREEGLFGPEERQPWQPEWLDVLKPDQRPGPHPLHEAGAFYILDPSSAICASVLQGVAGEASSVLDLCSAPGGKAIFAHRLLGPQSLTCNEVVGKRLGMLHGNLKRCGVDAELTSLDPAALAEERPEEFDLVIVDAPCSGQSLMTRGQEVSGCFHSRVVKGNVRRQRRILAAAAALTRPGGWLAYMTCTFAPEENEGNIEWLRDRFPGFSPVEVGPLQPFQSHLTDAPCYRVWPHRHAGAGGFACLLRRNEP